MRDFPNLSNVMQSHLDDLVQRFDEDPFNSRMEYAHEAVAILRELRALGGWIKADLYPDEEMRLREAITEAGHANFNALRDYEASLGMDD